MLERTHSSKVGLALRARISMSPRVFPAIPKTEKKTNTANSNPLFLPTLNRNILGRLKMAGFSEA